MSSGALLAVLLGAQGAASLSLQRPSLFPECRLPRCQEATPSCAGRLTKCVGEHGEILQNASEEPCGTFHTDCEDALCTSQDYVCHHAYGMAACSNVRNFCTRVASEKRGLIAVADHPLLSEDASRLPMFIHIPKNAGTAIEEAGARAGAAWGRHHHSLWAQNVMPTGDRCNGWHTPPAWWGDSLANPYTDKDTFCVVRDPYDRIVSEYLFLRMCDYAGDITRRWMDWSAHSSCTREDLNDFVQRTMKVAMETDKYILDCHALPQSNFVWGANGQQWCTNIIQMNSLTESLDGIRKYSALTNLTLEKENDHEGYDDCKLSAKDLDETSRAMVARMYAEDFLRLGFDV